MRSYYCSIIYTSFQSTGPLNPALKGASMAIWEALFSFSHHAAWLFVVFRGQDSAVVRCYSKSRHSPSVGKKKSPLLKDDASITFSGKLVHASEIVLILAKTCTFFPKNAYLMNIDNFNHINRLI